MQYITTVCWEHVWTHFGLNKNSGAQAQPYDARPLQALGIHKGTRIHVDAYSAFYDNGKLYQTGLHDILRGHGITRLYVVGVALDFCVLWSSRDAVELGYEVAVVSDATKGVAPETCDAAVREFARLGIRYISSEEVLQEITEEAAAAVTVVV
jgi:nicotinamidase/pyrazinamidase